MPLIPISYSSVSCCRRCLRCAKRCSFCIRGFLLTSSPSFSRGFSFRKLQIFISQTTNSHFANYRFPFRKLQIFISQTTDFHFVSFHFVSFHFVSLHFVSQTTVSRLGPPCCFHQVEVHHFNRPKISNNSLTRDQKSNKHIANGYQKLVHTFKR